jgi:hypothetical protein
MSRTAFLLLLAVACSRPPGDGTGAASSGAAPPPASAASASAAPASSGTPGATTWTGTYKSVAGTLTVPPVLKHVHWAGQETGAGIGDGAISFTIDSGTGRVDGSLDGPLGPALVAGYASGATVTANISRKDPTDHAFAGTLVGTIAGDHIDGTANLSLATAGAVRTATFTLAKH